VPLLQDMLPVLLLHRLRSCLQPCVPLLLCHPFQQGVLMAACPTMGALCQGRLNLLNFLCICQTTTPWRDYPLPLFPLWNEHDALKPEITSCTINLLDCPLDSGSCGNWNVPRGLGPSEGRQNCA